MDVKFGSFRPVIISIFLGCLFITVAVIFAGLWIEHSQNDYRSNPEGHIWDKTGSNERGAAKIPDGGTSTTPKLYKSGTGTYGYAAVASELKICSDIGRDILARRGNAVDATVAVLLCNGVEHPQSSGIGGGAFFVIYDKKQGWFAVNSREVAPAKASQDMFTKPENKGKSRVGGMASGIPGELKGMYEIHKRFGTIPWKTLVAPTLQILRNNHRINKHLYTALFNLHNRTGFEAYLDYKGHAKPVGSLIHDQKLLKTFEIIAEDPMSFYNGRLAEDIVADIREEGGIFTLDDLKNYTAVWKNTTKMDLPGDLTLHSMPPPGSGVVISYILSILSGYNMIPKNLDKMKDKILTYHRIVEAMKFAYGKRSALGDEDFVDIESLVQNMTSRSFGEETRQKINDAHTMNFTYYDSAFYNEDDHGTNHLSVIDREGNAVAVTTTINTYFGSDKKGRRTGIHFNDQMDDFSTPNLTNAFGFLPSASNFIKPGKHPQSSMSPTIIWDNKAQKVRVIVGAAGGSRITSTTAVLLMDVLWFGMSMTEAMDKPRFHHQLLPNHIVIEKEFSKELKAGLESKNHTFVYRDVMSVAHGIEITDKHIEAASDFRKGGQPNGI